MLGGWEDVSPKASKPVHEGKGGIVSIFGLAFFMDASHMFLVQALVK